jgi:hypothetical protein
MTQGARGSLSYVALTIANLYRTYLYDDSLNEDVQRCIIDSIEKRWGKTDQDSMLLAVILNPYIRHTLFKQRSGYYALIDVHRLLERMWKRFFPEPCDPSFFRAVGMYYRRQGKWSDEDMLLHHYTKEVRTICSG